MSRAPGTPIPLLLRLVLVAEVFFGLAALVSIVADPANTRTNFAWDIQPVVMASVLGAYYVSAAPLALLALFARRWEMIRGVVLATAAFTAALLLTTVLHWSRFSVGTLPFWVWLLSYLIPPPALLIFYFVLERRARQSGSQAPTDPLPSDVRLALIHWGALLAVVTVVIYLFPQVLMAVAPWTMSPLATRALVSFMFAAALLMLLMARENDRARVKIGTPMLLLMFPAVTIQIARFVDQVNFKSLGLFGLYGILLIAFVLGVYLARGSWRPVFQ